ncbi:MAG TPA: chromosomal replication initiator protein DnaA [Lachnospiraceae bacterium]|nr:chromosomal replication initiator protein DnaA [Lachnospiraceae bacterium]
MENVSDASSQAADLDLQQIFDQMIALIKTKLTDITYNTWFKTLKPITIDNNILILESVSPIGRKIIESRYRENVLQSLKEIGHGELNFKVYDQGTYTEQAAKKLEKEELNIELAKKSGLNVKYTFDNFIQGPNNQLAFAAALAVAEMPGQAYNPLYIWGNPGLGKTHLMQAIAHHVLDTDPSKKVLYVTSETFTNELITSISHHTNEEFRRKYRDIDVLLIDDIQFLESKQGTQMEFFNTFNALYENNKQIVIAGDRRPEEIKTLEERIRSRFKSGMVADIKPPDYETRVAILQKKAENNGISIDMSVLGYIATVVSSNIRELEGALTRVQAFAKLYPNRKLDIALAQEALKDFLAGDAVTVITVPRITSVVCERYNVTVSDLQSKKKPKEIAYPRQIAMYLSRKLTEEPLDRIGSYFGGRDHTTVAYAVSKISDDLKGRDGDELRRSIEDMERRIKGE